jgi:hypothetical protein
MILANPILIDTVFKNSICTKFLVDAWSILNEKGDSSNEISAICGDIYFKLFIEQQAKATCKTTLDYELISMIPLNKETFTQLVNYFIINNDTNEDGEAKINTFCNILLRNQSFVFNETDLESLELFYKSVTTLFQYLSHSKTVCKKNSNLKLNEFIGKAFSYKPNLVEHSAMKFDLNIEDYFDNKETLKINGDVEMKDDGETKSDIDSYSFTLSDRNKQLIKELFHVDSKLNCFTFKMNEKMQKQKEENENLKSKKESTTVAAFNFKATMSLLEKEATMSDFITLNLNDNFLTLSYRNYPVYRKLSDLTSPSTASSRNDENLLDLYSVNANIYDPIYILPNFFHLLDYGELLASILNF